MNLKENGDERCEDLSFLRALTEVIASDLRPDTALARAVDLCFVRFELEALCAFRFDEAGVRLIAAQGLGPVSRARLDRVTEHDLSAMLGGLALSPDRDLKATEACTAIAWEEGGGRPRAALLATLAYAHRRLGALLVIAHEGQAMGPHAVAVWEPIVSSISVALRAADDFERLASLEAEKRQLVDNLPLIVARTDARTGALAFINGAVERVLGVRPEDALGAGGLDCLLADDAERETARAARDRALMGKREGWGDRRYRHADGRVLTLRECTYPVLGGARTVEAVETIAYDITTEIEARRGLMQADRLAALGALAAGLAHEINNPVAFIGLAAGQAGRLVDAAARGDVEAAGRVRETLAEIGEAASRIAEIVGELKLFTRIGDGSVSCPVDVNRILQTALALTSAELRRHARLEVDMGPLPVAPGSFVNLGHVFVNLLMNAAQAIDSKLSGGPDDGGGEQDVIRVATRLQDGAIVVCVEDSGIGISEAALPRIFDPFFKVSPKGGGAGLGLAIARDLVRRVGGEIRVTSRHGCGTRFEIVLPLGPAHIASDAPASTPLRTPSKAADPLIATAAVEAPPRVLIIDDEKALARALARQLAARFRVETACTARDGLAMLTANDYDAVVCDVRMPGQSGPQIHAQVAGRSTDQASRFIFTTGGSRSAIDDELLNRALGTGLPMLEKPFEEGVFAATVAAVASRARG